jgi:hypothetical protein
MTAYAEAIVPTENLPNHDHVEQQFAEAIVRLNLAMEVLAHAPLLIALLNDEMDRPRGRPIVQLLAVRDAVEALVAAPPAPRLLPVSPAVLDGETWAQP